MGTRSTGKVRTLAAFADPDSQQVEFDDLMRFATMIAPKVTIQGGTTEVLRGIIAVGLPISSIWRLRQFLTKSLFLAECGCLHRRPGILRIMK